MLRQASLAAITLSIFLTTDHAASAQVVAYDHRSTVYGDHLAGASELVRAQGSYLRDEADAAETWVRATAARDALLYQRAEYRYQEKSMQIQYLKEKADARRERDAVADNTETAQAMRLWQSAQRGYVSWPSALQRSEYVGSLSLIESLLRSFNPNNASTDVYRRALATEAAVLRTRVASNQNIKFEARAEAVRTLSRVQRLVEMPGADTATTTTQQLAMR